jgi:NAD(P)-dependent dehydrogenase (short-subunit alcohol dehydrogenase family)
MYDLDGKGVVVTGGASGIGQATAERFLEEGARVVILDRDSDALDKMLHRFPTIEGLVTDIGDPEQVEAAFGKIDRLIPDLEILINNAGISIRHSFLEITPEEWQQVIKVNLNGVFYVAQAAAKKMMNGKGGVILNMGSTNGLVGTPYYADYNATKAGVIELTKSMAIELAPKVRVNAICPGYVMTPMQRAEYTDEMIEKVNSKIPLKRHASPEEVANLFAFLASSQAQYFTGQTFVIDGGEICGGMASR